jgi:hypothetical protein
MRKLLVLLLTLSLTSACSDETSAAKDGGSPDMITADGATDVIADTQPADSAPIADTSTSDSAPKPDLGLGDVGLDSSPDASLVDAAPIPDLSNGFVKAIAGTWLIGWSGGMNHYSWLQLTPTSDTGGTAFLLDGAKLKINAPYWACSGAASWNITSKPRTIQLHLPSASCNGMKSTNLTFSTIKPAVGGYPKGAIDQASVDDSSAPTGLGLEAYRFPATQCTPKLSSCTDPL